MIGSGVEVCADGMYERRALGCMRSFSSAVKSGEEALAAKFVGLALGALGDVQDDSVLQSSFKGVQRFLEDADSEALKERIVKENPEFVALNDAGDLEVLFPSAA